MSLHNVVTLGTGSFPDQCKIAKIVPIFKKGEVNKFSNHRPVSVLPAVSKIFERLMYNRLITFIDQLNIIMVINLVFGRTIQHPLLSILL